MALNIGASGIIRPYVKYNAKSDKWFVRGEGGGDLEIARPTFLLDLANIRTGWLHFADGQAPQRLIDPALDKVAPKPDETFKRGFVVMAFSPKFFGGAVEMASASIHVSNAIRDVYAVFEEQAGRTENRGKVPVIACVEDAAASGGYWLACAADEIIVDPASIVGSIGVIAASFGLEGAIGRIGVERRMHTAGTEKSFLDPFRPERPEDVARLETLLAELHVIFKDWVRSRRGPKLKAGEEELFSGRFWVGARAVELGLADGVGEASSLIKARFGEKAQVVSIGARRPPWPPRR